MKDKVTQITLVRHGHVHNPDDIVYGRLPGFGLSAVGRQQVEAAARSLEEAELRALYSSPQQRAQETAKIIQEVHPDLEIATAPTIDEIDNYFEGHPVTEVAARGWDLYTGVDNGYETPRDIAARAASFIMRARRLHTGQHIAAVSHGDVIAFAVLWAMQQAIEVSRKRSLDRFGIEDRYPATASLTTLRYASDDPNVLPDLVYVRPYGSDLALAALS